MVNSGKQQNDFNCVNLKMLKHSKAKVLISKVSHRSLDLRGVEKEALQVFKPPCPPAHYSELLICLMCSRKHCLFNFFFLFYQRLSRNKNDPDHWFDYGTFCLLIGDFGKVRILTMVIFARQVLSWLLNHEESRPFPETRKS